MIDTLFSDEELNKLTNETKDKCAYDKYYIATSCIKKRKEKIDHLWDSFKHYADKHFLQQYKFDFHPRIWEMYLGCIFLDQNMSIFTNSTWPDFFINNEYYVECVACNEWTGENKVIEVAYEVLSPIDCTYHEKQLLRITSVIDEKIKKYNNDIEKKIIDPNRPFILALNSAKLWDFQSYGDIPLILQAVIGFQWFQYSNKWKKNFLHRDKIIKKPTDALIGLNIFENDTFKEISGIIFCDQYVINHPDNIWDDCIFINNPFTRNPINIHAFSFLKRRYIEAKEEWLQITKLYN